MARITVTTKVNEEEYEQIQSLAEQKGMSMSGLLKSLCMKAIEGDSEVMDEITQMCFLYDIRDIALVKNIRTLLDRGKIFIVNGSMKWNPLAMNPDYISLDDMIDLMKISDREKDRLKRKIASELERIARQDDLGNGAGV